MSNGSFKLRTVVLVVGDNLCKHAVAKAQKALVAKCMAGCAKYMAADQREAE